MIRIHRRIYWYGGGQSRDQRVDGWLGIADGGVSVAARELCCRVSVCGVSFTSAAHLLDRVGNIRVSKERMRQIVEGEGQAVLAGREAGVVRPNWDASDCPVSEGGPTRIIVGSDGVMAPMVTEAEKQKRRANQAAKRRVKKQRRKARRAGRPRRGADQSYKEFKIGTFYDQSRKHQYAFGTAGDHQELGRQIRREAAKLNLSRADEKLSVSDGAKWIRRQLQVRLPMLDEMILDYRHLGEHVAASGRICFGEGSQAAEEWRDRVMGLVYNDGPAAMLVAIEQRLAAIRSPAKRQSLQGLRQYVAERVDMLDYPAFRAKGFDLGSGPTEAFCKTLTARLKGSGMRWDRPNAEAMMALAALDHSNLWQHYWNAQRQAA